MEENNRQANPIKQAQQRPAGQKPTAKKNSSLPKRLLMLLVFVAVILAVWFFLIRDGDATVETNGSKLQNITTYLSRSSSDADKRTQTVFQQGDPIQVGFTYESGEQDAFVRYIVKKQGTDEEVFTTNLFKLSPGESEQFVSINNTSLPPGAYTVELQDTDNTAITSLDYEINE